MARVDTSSPRPRSPASSQGRNHPYDVSKYGVVALSEGLRRELAPRGIGVSVLCPGFIRTQIMDSSPQSPRASKGRSPPADVGARSPSWINWVQGRVSGGIDPLYVGELVREGIEKDWPYIFTDLEFEPMIEARFAAIKQGFDHYPRAQPETLSARPFHQLLERRRGMRGL